MSNSASATSLFCLGCGRAIEAPLSWRCPDADSAGEHIVARALDVAAVPWSGLDDDPNPFVRYRHRLHSYQRALAGGLEDRAYVATVHTIDDRIAAVDGRRFVETPLLDATKLAAALGVARLWVKNETGNVSGSHKARHLMGIALHLVHAGAAEPRPRLAIASCGNAGLAAAVVARAIDWPIDVFIPEGADPHVKERLEEHGARLVICPRREGEVGDPSFLRFKEAVEGGALPFSCQGTENGLTVEGGETLGYELVDQLTRAGATLDRVVVQVGGAALASAVANALIEAHEAGVLARLPRLHTVQTRGAFPLARAYERFASFAVARLQGKPGAVAAKPSQGPVHGTASFDAAETVNRQARADLLRAAWGSPALEDALRYAAAHRELFMWPWEVEPHSLAHGILDDETYDWFAVLRGMLRSGGFPVVVSEPELAHAHALAREHTEVMADHTGTSGLAGLHQLRASGCVQPGESVAVLFTGIDRAHEASSRLA